MHTEQSWVFGSFMVPGRVESLPGGTALKLPVSPLRPWVAGPLRWPLEGDPVLASPVCDTQRLTLRLVAKYPDKWDRKERVRDPQKTEMLELADIEFKITD